MPDVVEFPAKTGKIPPPDWLQHDASKEQWETLVPLLQAAKILTQVDLTALAHYCDLHGTIIDMRQRRADVPMAMYAQLRGFQADFALNPKSRIAPNVPTTAKANAFNGRGKMPT